MNKKKRKSRMNEPAEPGRILTAKIAIHAVVLGHKLAVKNARASYAVTVVLTLVTGVVPPLQVWLVGSAVGSFGNEGFTSRGIAAFIALAFLFGIANAINSLRDVGAARLATHLSVSSQSDLLAAVSAWSPAKLENPGERDRLEIMWDTTSSRINDFIGQGILWVSSAISALGVVSVLISVSPVVAGLIVLSTVGPLLTTPYLYRIWNAVAEANAPMERLTRVLGVYLVSPVGFLDAVSSRSFSAMSKRHRNLLRTAADNHLRAVDREALVGLCLALWTTVTLGAALLRLVQIQASPGDVAATLTAMTTMGSMIGLVSIGTSLVQMTPFVVELVNELAGRRSPQVGLGYDRSQAQSPTLTSHHVSFAYPGSRAALEDVNCSFHAGTVTAVVGANGAGKSTLLKVLQGLYEPTSGVLELHEGANGPKSMVSPDGRIYSMLQDVPRPPVPLRDYLSCGMTPTDKIMLVALADAGIDFLNADDLNRMIGAEYEGGLNVSGGEWQRIAFARLLLSSAMIWLLDEPSSALDPDSEANMMDRLKVRLQNRVAVVVSHRLSTVLKADHVYVVEHGRIAEEGNPHLLLRDRSSRFATLFRSQIFGTAEGLIDS